MSVETEQELEALRRAGRVVAETIAEVKARVRPGMTTAEVDAVGEEVFARHGARSAPREEYGFPGCLCLSVDDEAVHGIPGDRLLRAGDLLKVDVTAELDGYVADACETVVVGAAADREAERLRAAADAALRRALGVATAGVTLREVGAAVERVVEARGFSVLRDLCGHGVGRAVHEPPSVPSWDAPWADERLHEGLVMTIEPIIGAGGREVVDGGDGWTIRTADGARSAHAEHTIVITRGRPIVLTAAAA